jgi:RNA polymerase sigma factor (sigma-70 family)
LHSDETTAVDPLERNAEWVTAEVPEPFLPACEDPIAMTDPAQEHAREKFFAMFRRQLGTLYRFVRHELAYRRNAGDLIGNELSPEDVVDAVVLRAFPEYVRDPPRRRAAGWLIRLAQEQIDSEVRRLESERETDVHVEDDVPETAPQEEVTTLGEEILYFYQPDEDLKLEDLIPELDTTTPEEDAQAHERRVVVRATLEQMPADERRAFLLRRMEGLSMAELAEAIGRPRREVERLVEEAQNRVRRRLAEGGYREPAARQATPR